MSEDHEETIMKVFSDVAESLAFMFVEPPDDEPLPEPDSPCVLTKMDFRGPFTGTLALATPESLCPEIAANVLGLDPDDELIAAKPHDALKELLNVTCGNLLTAIAGDEPVFDLTVPEVSALEEDSWNALKESPGAVALILEDRPVLLKLLVGGGAQD